MNAKTNFRTWMDDERAYLTIRTSDGDIVTLAADKGSQVTALANALEHAMNDLRHANVGLNRPLIIEQIDSALGFWANVGSSEYTYKLVDASDDNPAHVILNFKNYDVMELAYARLNELDTIGNNEFYIRYCLTDDPDVDELWIFLP